MSRAAFCDQALREADGAVSLVRVVDVITHTERGPNAPVEMPEFRCPLEMVLIFKSGTVRGRHEVTITPELPSGETLQPMVMEVRLEGEGRGAVIVATA